MTANKYSNAKLCWFPEKLAALADGVATPPICVRIKPTNHCPDACSWCVYGHGDGYRGVMHDTMQDQSFLTTEHLIEILDDLAAMGVLGVTFSGGGEPMAHPGFAVFADHARAVGLSVSVITNGLFLEGAKAQAIDRAAWVRVSIDYWNAASRCSSRGGSEYAFDRVCRNIRKFNDIRQGDLAANFVVTRENYEHIFDAAVLIRELGMDNVRFSPVWVDNFVEYHAPIADTVGSLIDTARGLETDDFSVYSAYRIRSDATIRDFERCRFQEVVPVIAADARVYRCHNTAYSDVGMLGCILNQKFSDLWFSPETWAKILAHRPKRDCCGIQCAADAKNKLYEELIAARGDVWV